MLTEHLQTITSFLTAHPYLAGLLTFLVVFCEAMAVIGVVIPGTITMTAIGVLVGSKVIPAGSTFTLAIIGAILGDYLSYLIGVYYQDRLHKIWPFNKHPKLLAYGESFFHKHGGKSVLIGRFVAPLRAMIPMVAGMMKMPLGRFLLAAIPSASIWAVGYILPGVLLGALALELPPKVATEFLLFVMLVIVVIWLTIWLIKNFFKQACYFVDYHIMQLWLFLNRFRAPRQILRLLADPRDPNDHGQLTILFMVFVTGTLFLLIMISVIHHGLLTYFNNPLYHLLRSFRTSTLDHIFLPFTLLGESKTMLIASAAFATWLLGKRYFATLIHWIALVTITAGSIGFFKHIIFSPRPNGLLVVVSPASFPSGHACLSLALFGFLAVIISREMKGNLRWLPYIISTILVALISFSRLYLGAHWLTDVVAGIFLSLTLVLLCTLSYRRHHLSDFDLKKTISVILGIVILTWSIYALLHFKKETFNYTPFYPSATITQEQWLTQPQPNMEMPLYRASRLGQPVEALNIEWLGSLDDIEKTLTDQGWQNYAIGFAWQTLIQRLAMQPKSERSLPLLSQLYHNHPEALLLTKNDASGAPYVILRLWQSDIKVSDATMPLWIGTVFYFHKTKEHKNFSTAIPELLPYLKSLKTKMVSYPANKQPAEMLYLEWDGNVMLVY